MFNLTPNGSSQASDAPLTLGTIDFESISSDPMQDRLPRGAYLFKVTEVRVNRDKKRAEFLLDVAAGEKKGFYAERPNAPWFLHVIYLKDGEPKAKLHTKRDLQIIAGYDEDLSVEDAFDAWNQDLRAFIGKLVGATVSYRETENNYGEVELMPSISPISATDYINGSYKVPGNQHLNLSRDQDDMGVPHDPKSLIQPGPDTDEAEEKTQDPLDENPWGDADD